MELKDLLEMLKQRVEQGEDANKVFEENKHLFEKCETETKKHMHKMFDENYEVDIRVYRKPGMGNSVQMLEGSKLSIMTGLTSLMQTAIEHNIWPSKKQMLSDLNNALKDKGEN